VPEGVFVVDQQLVEEGKGRVHAMGRAPRGELVRDYRGQAGLIRQNVELAAAKHDRGGRA